MDPLSTNLVEIFEKRKQKNSEFG